MKIALFLLAAISSLNAAAFLLIGILQNQLMLERVSSSAVIGLLSYFLAQEISSKPRTRPTAPAVPKRGAENAMAWIIVAMLALFPSSKS